MKATIDLYTIATLWILWLISYVTYGTLVKLDGEGSWPVLGSLTASGLNIASALTAYLIATALLETVKGSKNETK